MSLLQSYESLRSLHAPIEASIGPVGGGFVRLFQDWMASIKFSSTNTLQIHVNELRSMLGQCLYISKSLTLVYYAFHPIGRRCQLILARSLHLIRHKRGQLSYLITRGDCV